MQWILVDTNYNNKNHNTYIVYSIKKIKYLDT